MLRKADNSAGFAVVAALIFFGIVAFAYNVMATVINPSRTKAVTEADYV